MNAEGLIAWLADRGAMLEAVAGELHCDAPAGILSEEVKRQLTAHKPEILDALTRRPAPQSLCQQRLWFLQRLNPENTGYNEQAALALRGPLELGVLEQALDEIARRHEILRTSFGVSSEAVPVQVVREFAPQCLSLIDLSESSLKQARQVCEQATALDAARPFDLEAGPPVRMKLIRIRRDEHVLVIVMHHIISDGWSMGILWREFATFYAAFSAGTPSTLGDLPRQYAAFARWQLQLADSERERRVLAYWKAKLAGATLLLDLPSDWPRPALQSFAGATYDFQIASATAALFRELSRRAEASPFLCGLALFQILLYRYSGQADFLVGVPVSGRDQARFEALLGYFSNTVVARASFHDQPSFLDLVVRARETMLEAYAHQSAPFERVVDALQPARSLSHSPLFQAVFTYQAGMLRGPTIPRIDVELLRLPGNSSKFDLVLSLSEQGDGLAARFTYCSALFRRETIARMASHFCNLLESGLTNDSVGVDELEMLDAQERAVFELDLAVPELEEELSFTGN